MRKLLTLLVPCFIGPLCANGQISASLAGDSAQYLLYEAAKLSHTFIYTLMPDGFNTVRLGYTYEKGTFVPAQGSTQIRAVSFNTEGKTTLGKVALWGQFGYQRITEDSTRFAHQTRNNTTTPYYMGSPVPVSYNRNVYQAKAIAQRVFLSNHLPLAVGLNYRIGDHYSVNDPRGSMSDYQFDLSAGTGYIWRSKLTTTIDGYYGYGQEQLNVAYKNINYVDSHAYPAYANYLINGYGEPALKRNDRVYRNKMIRSGGGASFVWKDSITGIIAATGKWIREQQRYIYQSGAGFDSLALYTLTTSSMHVVWSRRAWTATLDYEAQKGEDFHVRHKANNYQYRGKNYGAQITHSRNGNNYSVSVASHSTQRLDGTTGNHIHYTMLTLRPSFGMVRQSAKQDYWGYAVTLHYGKATDKTLSVNDGSAGMFTQQVIYHDYYFNTADQAGGYLDLHYNKYFPGYYAGIKASIIYLRGMNFSALVLDEAMMPGKDRVSASLSLNFYF
ncbi:DUF6850 family outer membrane beta-barrel protein [Chitinophaga rhizophila]|uniref:DUF6850 domain-containing protein n=1 Tax=Chitinophaga rhizophila TaxID=2866212 RepID=A0ABS7G7T4_9BACT|nr:DUF6850 family outer membrane beta-barrel protein [Chitinophaga rhizophila]MBW8682859.1 hypothetical protein [Chitinophaga rhizophila]